MTPKKILTLLVLLICGTTIFAQRNDRAASKSDVKYEVMYDEPDELYKMWIHFIPMYADFFQTNFNVGYGIQANYYLKNKFDFRLQYRKAYTKSTDFSRGIGEKSQTTDNKLAIFQYVELGATYHIKDEATAGTARMVLTSKRYSDDKWAATVPEHILIPSKVRKIYGVRAGGYYWASATNLGNVASQQGVALTSATNDTLNLRAEKIFSNLRSTGFYLGGSLARIRNVAIKPQKYDPHANDMIFTAYADVLIAPFTTLDAIKQEQAVYDVSAIKGKNLGFRAGIEGMYNRAFAWGWGGEIGYRPSLQGRSFYINARVSFTFATSFDQKRTSTQIVKPSE
ncbi:MAG: hypothetical protein H7Y04_03345 [Verrucomicrobia bacterium]|nr:hypothetical protein [Cytophagales bacterium]